MEKADRVDKEMRSDIKEQKKTKAGNMFIYTVLIGIVLILISIAGGYWSTSDNEGQHNMGKVTSKDTLILNKSDTVK
ncbi:MULTISPECIES: hypothetical protein [unclassified Arcicella]|uniref:hypothetical protein n=1 Tax=unclassified Arcicella TaxID=2644986 RepID=UPI00285C8394|nr:MULTISPECIES: hypothetical protein [unclassified Arcicella]MDR6562981.1 hypothetical protein [Arcicella sp. BE51]MDR6813065.1 hypothetical protein [Arcicella sp. BE140]MDR6824379.1 hypothetical protein [Arcicella sp. BE139]